MARDDADMPPNFADVQAHYDLSDEFFALFLDPTRTYSCAYFEREDMSLGEAQLAKIDLALGKLDLRSGQRLLDIGCGWGACLRRAVTRFDVRGVGLTLSVNQRAHAQSVLDADPLTKGRAEVRLAGWEQFDEPVDAIVSIGAFEHFRVSRFGAFFERCNALLPVGGRMLLHTIVWHSLQTLQERGLSFTHEDVLFAKFIRREIFPGGQLASPEVIEDHARGAGFMVERVHPLCLHYACTLETWAESLRNARSRAIALTSEATCETYMRYLTGCAARFRSGHLDVVQFTLRKA